MELIYTNYLIVTGVQLILCCVFVCLCVLNVASFSGLSIIDWQQTLQPNKYSTIVRKI